MKRFLCWLFGCEAGCHASRGCKRCGCHVWGIAYTDEKGTHHKADSYVEMSLVHRIRFWWRYTLRPIIFSRCGRCGKCGKRMRHGVGYDAMFCSLKCADEWIPF